MVRLLVTGATIHRHGVRDPTLLSISPWWLPRLGVFREYFLMKRRMANRGFVPPRKTNGSLWWISDIVKWETQFRTPQPNHDEHAVFIRSGLGSFQQKNSNIGHFWCRLRTGIPRVPMIPPLDVPAIQLLAPRVADGCVNSRRTSRTFSCCAHCLSEWRSQ